MQSNGSGDLTFKKVCALC